MEHKDCWISILKRLQPTIKKAHFITWLQNTKIIAIRDGVLVVGVPTAYAQTWIEAKYNIKILQAAEEIDSTIQKVSYVVSSDNGVDVKALFPEIEKKVRKVPNKNEVRVCKDGECHQSQILNARYRLHNFVIGIENRLPHAACEAVSKSPGGLYNPLYIYGDTGMGKTHLLQAIGNEILRNDNEMVVHYLTAERFVSEVVEAIGRRNMPKFKDRYRSLDCLLMDDVQFFMQKESSQREFFHTFNELYQMNKQIVITSDRPPAELDDLDGRLKSRFAMGMVVEIIMPDFETRLAILNEKCKEFQLMLAPEVLDFIAKNVTNSVRELEGVLRQILGESDFFNRVPTISTVAGIIRRMNKAQQIIGYDIEAKRALAKTDEEVINIVANYYGLSAEQLTGKDRHREVMMPRQICMYLIKNELGQSYQKIGKGFGQRNHTTVMHACNKTASRLKRDLRLVRDVNAIKHEMGL